MKLTTYPLSNLFDFSIWSLVKITLAILLILPNDSYSFRYASDSSLYQTKPKNLEEAFSLLDSIIPKKKKLLFMQKDELRAQSMFYFELGMFIRNEWIRHGDSSFSNLFSHIHPEDASVALFIIYHRKLHNKELEFEKLVMDMRASTFWREMRKKEDSPTAFKKFSINDTVIYPNPNDLQEFCNCYSKGIVIGKIKKYLALKVKFIEICDEHKMIESYRLTKKGQYLKKDTMNLQANDTIINFFETFKLYKSSKSK